MTHHRGRGDGGARLTTDAGYILVMTAIVIVPLLTFTAFAVDLGAWYAQKIRMQRAADSSALAGVVWALDPANRWQSTALSSAAANGFANTTSTQVTVQRIGTTRVQVKIAQKGRQYFSSVLLKEQQLTATGTADYQRPLHMGSPENRLGTDPDLGYQPYFWLNTGSDTTVKANGDRFASMRCSVGGWGCAAGTNTEYSPDGYTFRVAVGPLVSAADVRIEVYDPAYTYSGDLCNNIYVASSDMDAVQSMAAARFGESSAVSAARYGRSTYCPGDQSLGNGVAPNTTFIVRAPDLTPLNDYDNPALCAITFDGRKPASNAALADLLAGLDSASPSGREQSVFADHYHRWFTICTIPAAMVSSLIDPQNGGEFVVQVKTTASLAAPPPPTTTASPGLSIGTLDTNVATGTGGYNRYSLRAGRGMAGSVGWSDGITVYGPSRLPIYVNGVDVANGTPNASVPSTTFSTSFFATRITPDYAGNVLQLNFWDIGDVSGSPGTVDFTLTSADPAVTSSMLSSSNCSFTRDGMPLVAGNPYSVIVSGCQVSGLKSGSGDPSTTGFNGRLVGSAIPVPLTYTCSLSDAANGCWVKVSATYRGVPSDSTTWSATMLGGPLHLVD